MIPENGIKNNYSSVVGFDFPDKGYHSSFVWMFVQAPVYSYSINSISIAHKIAVLLFDRKKI